MIRYLSSTGKATGFHIEHTPARPASFFQQLLTTRKVNTTFTDVHKSWARTSVEDPVDQARFVTALRSICPKRFHRVSMGVQTSMPYQTEVAFFAGANAIDSATATRGSMSESCMVEKIDNNLFIIHCKLDPGPSAKRDESWVFEITLPEESNLVLLDQVESYCPTVLAISESLLLNRFCMCKLLLWASVFLLIPVLAVLLSNLLPLSGHLKDILSAGAIVLGWAGLPALGSFPAKGVINRIAFKASRSFLLIPATIVAGFLASVAVATIVGGCILAEARFKSATTQYAESKSVDLHELANLFGMQPHRLEPILLAEGFLNPYREAKDRKELEKRSTALLSHVRAAIEGRGLLSRFMSICSCNGKSSVLRLQNWMASVSFLRGGVNTPEAFQGIDLDTPADSMLGSEYVLFLLNGRMDFHHSQIRDELKSIFNVTNGSTPDLENWLSGADNEVQTAVRKALERRNKAAFELEQIISDQEFVSRYTYSHFLQEAYDHLAQHQLILCQERAPGVPASGYVEAARDAFNKALSYRKAAISAWGTEALWFRSPGKLGIYHIFLKLDEYPRLSGASRLISGYFLNEKCPDAMEMLKELHGSFTSFHSDGDSVDGWRQGINLDSLRDLRNRKLLNELDRGWRVRTC